MKKLALVVLALGMLACNNGRSSGNDSGTNITLGDTGPAGNDAYVPPGNDAATTGGACSVTITAASFGSLSAGCFPRCQAATLNAVNACAAGDNACVDAAFGMDTTPTIPWMQNGTAATMPLDCQTCYSVQALHCISANGCSAEVTAYLMCDPTAADCSAQNTALDNCQTTNNAAITTCANDPTMGIAACVM